MQRPFPEYSFNSAYLFLRQNEHILPPLAHSLPVPMLPAIAEAPSSTVQLVAPRNYPYPVIADIETLNGVNITRPFRTTNLIPDQWIEEYTSGDSDRQPLEHGEVAMRRNLEISSEDQARETSRISDELFSSLSDVLGFSDEDTEETLVQTDTEVSTTGGVLSGFFICYLPLLLEKKSRNNGLQSLQNSLSVFANAIASLDLGCMTDKERRRVQKLHRRCVNFRRSLSWALDDLRTKLRHNCNELLIMKCIKTVFILVLSLYCREKGYSLDISETSEISEHRNEPKQTFQAVTDVVPFNGNISMYQVSEAIYRRLMPSISHSQFPRFQGTAHDITFSANQHDEFIAQEEQVFLERRLPVPTDGALVTMFHSHIVPMTPVIARNNGRYVRGTQRTELSIMDAAYAYDTANGGCVIPCDFVLNRTYTPENNSSTQLPRYLTYVGFVYPDNTMLSYIPIKYVRIVYEDSPHRQPILRSGTTTFAFLHMDLPNAVYQNLKTLAKNVYKRKEPNMLFVDHFEELLLDGRMVRIEVLVKSERTVRIEDQGKYLDYPVLQALFQCRHDLCGKALMHLRFTSTKRGSQRMQLRLILFGITVERNAYNYQDSIFELLNAPPGPIQAPLPVPQILF